MRDRIAVLASGRGSNLQAILDAIAAGRLEARVVLVLSEQPDAYALERARQAGVPHRAIPRKGFTSSQAHDAAIGDAVEAAGAHWIVLAGYMRLLGPAFVARFPSRVINIHPALLPAFPGVHGQRDALAYGVKVSGCTVHFVDEGVDSGPVLAQRVVPVLPDDREQDLAARILAQEHQVYAEVIGWLVAGRVRREGRIVRILDSAAADEV